MSTYRAAYQRIMGWLEAAPDGDAKRLGERLRSKSSLSKGEMDTLCGLAEVINESVVLVKLTLRKGKVKAECQDPHFVLEEWDYPEAEDVERIAEETFKNVREPICLCSELHTSGLKGLVATGTMKEHFHPKGMEFVHDANPPESCMFTITHMYDVASLAQMKEDMEVAEDTEVLPEVVFCTPKKRKAEVEAPPAPKRIGKRIRRVLDI